MLIGSYSAVLGDSRRIAVPKKFLEDLGDKPVIAKWYEDCLIMVSNDFWDDLSSWLVGSRKAADLGVRDIERFILGSAYELEPDEQGRIIIPSVLSAYAKLEKEVIFLGLIDRIELWPKTVWDKKAEKLAKSTKDYLEKLNKNGD